jgi:hypothetical protein
MKYRVTALASLIVLGAGMSYAASQTDTQLSKAEVQSMVRSAHSTQQYQTLAAYFRSKQDTLEKQALAEKAEWDRRSQVNAALYQKYPRPVDSSRNRYEYFTYEANQMGQQAAHYEGLASNSQQLASK